MTSNTDFTVLCQKARNIANLRGILTEEEIRSEGLIETEDGSPVPKECYKAASFDIRLGEEYFDPSHIHSRTGGFESCEGGFIEIAPFASAIVSSFEVVKLPPFIAGRFNLRIKLALKGLIVQMGTQVEPGYHGRLFAMLQNISNNPIRISHKDINNRIFTIEFLYTTTNSVPEKKDKILKMSQFIKNNSLPHGTINTITNEIKETQNKLKEGAEQRRAMTISIVSIVVGAFLAVMASAIPAWIAGIYARPEIEEKVKQEISKATDNDKVEMRELIGIVIRRIDKIESEIISKRGNLKQGRQQ